MSNYDKLSSEQMLAFHSAPTLLGVKCANLFGIARDDGRLLELERLFSGSLSKGGFRMRILCGCQSRVLVYVYCEALLEAWLEQERTAAFLRNYGYAGAKTVEEKLDVLEGHMTCGEFPHEIGIFLGYPLDDVVGFIENQGKNCLLCGFWKVYSEPEKAKQLFDSYVYCRNYLCNKLHQGLCLEQALAGYKEEIK